MATENRYIAVSYDLRLERNGEWKLREKAPADAPFTFVSGMGMALDDFENAIVPLAKGEQFNFELSPEQAYGEYMPEGVQTLPRDTFEINGKLDEEYIYIGAIVPLHNSEGERFNGTITNITDTEVTVDLNHPFAGRRLRFTGEVLENREATIAEVGEMLNMLDEESRCGECDGQCGGGCKGGCRGGGGNK